MHVHAQKPAQSKTAPAVGVLQRSCDECRKKKFLQRSAFGPAPETVPPIEHELPRTPGQPLDPAAPAFMGPRFAHDFSRIPAHSRSLPGIHAKLIVNAPGDVYEQEADRVAEQVLAAPGHPIFVAPPRVQQFPMQPAGQAGEAPASVDRVLASLGRPLEAALRQEMEGRFGYDFSGVRVHTGVAAEQSARDVNAHAYTVGQDIVFGTGQFAPGTQKGRQLIAHELTHVVHQNWARRSSTAGLLNPSQHLLMTHWAPIRSPFPGTAVGRTLQRQPDKEKRSFTPTKFSDPKVLIEAVVKDSPKEVDLVGACRYLDDLPMARTLSLALQIAARKPVAVAELRSTALQGWGTSHVRVALAVVELKGKISQADFAAEQALDLDVIPKLDAKQVLDVLAWSRKLTSGPRLLDRAKTSYQVWFDHILPESPKGVTQMWQVVENSYKCLMENCRPKNDKRFIVDIVDIGKRTKIKDSWGWTRDDDPCFAMQVMQATIGFDDQKSGYEQQTSRHVSESDAKALLKKMVGPRGTYSGIYTFVKSSNCDKCPEKLKELQDTHKAPDGEALAIEGVGSWTS